MIPILDLIRQYQTLQSDINNAILQVAASGCYILGPQVQAFEKEMAGFLGARHVIGCANGSDALFLALRALKIGIGDEVITTPFSYIATSESIVRTGATPVLIDIDPKTLNLNPHLIEKAITPRTKAILPVHLFGQPADMNMIMEIAQKQGLFVVEDAAQAINALYKGKQVGTLGDVGCFSFFPTKNLGAFGDGGMLVTQDDGLAERLKMLRVHGSSKSRYQHDEPGINSRLDEIQAAILRVKLPHLNRWTEARQQAAQRYDALLAPLAAEFIETPFREAHVRHVFHQYTIRLKTGRLPKNTLKNMAEERNRLQSELQSLGVQTMIYYPIPFYRQKTHENLGYRAADFPYSEAAAEQVLSLPMFPEITEEEQHAVCQALAKALQTMAVSIGDA